MGSARTEPVCTTSARGITIPRTGRFLSQDPFGGNDDYPVTLHRYLYAGDDPVDNRDPGGNEFSCVGVVTAMAIGAVIGGVSCAAADYALTGSVSLKSVVIGSLTGALSVLSGKAASAFGQPGGGQQYMTGDGISAFNLLKWAWVSKVGP
jgi:hypothetical protein